jgi:hypothetical protein
MPPLPTPPEPQPWILRTFPGGFVCGFNTFTVSTEPLREGPTTAQGGLDGVATRTGAAVVEDPAGAVAAEHQDRVRGLGHVQGDRQCAVLLQERGCSATGRRLRDQSVQERMACLMPPAKPVMGT